MTTLNEQRSGSLDPLVTILGLLAKVIDHGSTRDSHSMAQERVQAVLEMEEPAEVDGKTKRFA